MSNRALGHSTYINDYEIISLTTGITYAQSNFSALLVFSALQDLEISRKTLGSNISISITSYGGSIRDKRQLYCMFLRCQFNVSFIQKCYTFRPNSTLSNKPRVCTKEIVTRYSSLYLYSTNAKPTYYQI